jgi:hypothetical protein
MNDTRFRASVCLTPNGRGVMNTRSCAVICVTLNARNGMVLLPSGPAGVAVAESESGPAPYGEAANLPVVTSNFF